MGVSILSALDLNEPITYTHSEYEDLAYGLASNKEKLNNIRKKLKARNSQLFFKST